MTSCLVHTVNPTSCDLMTRAQDTIEKIPDIFSFDGYRFWITRRSTRQCISYNFNNANIMLCCLPKCRDLKVAYSHSEFLWCCFQKCRDLKVAYSQSEFLWCCFQKCRDSKVAYSQSEFPTFARTIPSNSKVSKSVISLLQQFNWTRFAVVSGNSITWQEATDRLKVTSLFFLVIYY